jgi:TonB family protein
MPDQRQILLSSDPAPRPSVIFLSSCAHLVAVVLIVVFRHAAGPQIVPAKYETVQIISGTVNLSFNSAGARAGRPHASPFRLHRSKRPARVPAGNAAEGAALQVLHEHAKQATSGMVASFRMRGFYGFSTEHYELAIQTAGKLPVISAAELPLHFEQYVTVEVTIDVDGRVAEARIVGGEAPPAVEQRLLAAVREFKYSPAKRDGTPIPSQVDIVVHIPS